MPQNDEQMNRRRQKREAQRKRQQAQARRMRLTLLLAVVVLALCGFGIYKLTQRTEGEATATRPPETTQETQYVNPIDKDPITKIHIKAAGDLNITDTVVNAGVSATGYDFGPVFRDVAAILSDADLTVMNFEGNVCGEPYGSATTSAPVEILEALRNCGVDLLQTANSCAINNGLNGLTSTLQSIRAAGIEPIGSYTTEAEFKASKGYTMTEVQGIRIAWVAFTKGLGGRGMPAGSENLVNLLYTDYHDTYQTPDEARITGILKNAAAEKPDLIIVLTHWGSEYNEATSKSQTRILNMLLKNGADVVIGTHPHMLQPIDFNEKAGTLVAYSLGDFFGDANRGATNYSIILDLEITKDDSNGTTKVTDYSYDCIYTVRSGESIGNKDHKVVRIEKAMQANRGNFLDKVTDAAYSSMEYALQRIGERIVMPEED